MTDTTTVRQRVELAEAHALLEPTWFEALFYDASFWLSAVTFTLGFSYRSLGLQHVPARGPALFIANHQSYFDPVIIGLAVRRHLSYLARDTLFDNPLFAWLIRTLQAVPIHQDGLGIDGLRSILKLLQAGKAVLVFPEGERCADGRVHPLQAGIQLLIKRTLAPVIPIGIAGAFEAWPRTRSLPIPAPLFLPATDKTIAVVVGPPVDVRPLAGLPRQELLDRLHAELQKTQWQAERLRRRPG
jgi:1-acyl-sn-glycerol-3-phosphate acyltransferase